MISGAETSTNFPRSVRSRWATAAESASSGIATTSPSTRTAPVPGLQASNSTSRVCVRGAIRSMCTGPIASRAGYRCCP